MIAGGCGGWMGRAVGRAMGRGAGREGGGDREGGRQGGQGPQWAVRLSAQRRLTTLPVSASSY